MFHFLHSIGTWLSSACALGFAAFWGWSSVFVDPKAASDGQVLDQAGLLLVVGLGISIIIVMVYALLAIGRGQKSPADTPALTVELEAAGEDFDPDAIIARHLEARAKAAPVAPRVRPVDCFRTTPRTASFGRKLA